MTKRLIAMVILAISLATPQAMAQDSPLSAADPVDLSADRMEFDHETEIVSASGNVEVRQGGYVLTADELTYDRRADTVTAKGNVELREPSGTVLTTEELELSDRLRNGVVARLNVTFTDNSHLKAKSGRRRGGVITEVVSAVYSPCEACEEEPEQPLMWRVRAKRVVHDERKSQIRYQDAFLEFWNFPVFYLPYLSHPDPTVKRESGFLTPEFGRSTDLGVRFGVPYYRTFGPNKDATFSPLLLSEEGLLMRGEYRHRTESGQFKFSGSIIHVDQRDDRGDKTGKKDLRGHIFGDGRFDLGAGWRWGFEFGQTTDDTFMRRFKISKLDTLVTRLYSEVFRGRSYASIDTYLFQGLEAEDDAGNIPIVLPEINVHYVGQPLEIGGHLIVDANVLGMIRRDADDVARASLAAGWEAPFVLRHGSVITTSASVRGDIYRTQDVPDPDGLEGDTLTEVTARVLPRAELDWRLPLVRTTGGMLQTIEPIINLVASPNGGNPADIPDEDSTSLQFDDTNLFGSDRFAGLDRWEPGLRANVGVQFGIHGSGGRSASLLVGQTFRAKRQDIFDPGSGLFRKRSDYVGRLTVSVGSYLDLVHRFRLDRSSLKFRRNEIAARVGPEYFRAILRYTRVDAEAAVGEIVPVEEFDGYAKMRLRKYWSLVVHGKRDLRRDSTFNAGFGLYYEGKCLDFSATYNRRFTHDRDFEPGTSLNFRISLRNIG